MKKYIIYTLMLATTGFFGSCSNDEAIDSRSIFETEVEYEPTGLDNWLLDNYIYPYNIQVKYRLDDKETSVDYDLVPANYDNAVTLAKIVKHVWLEAYDEIWGVNTTRQYVPKLIQFIGNVAYTESGSIVGQAEGGMKVILFNVNRIDRDNINVAQLNDLYFHTMHHEFVHILNQTKAFDPDYNRISESGYVGASWYQIDNDVALRNGFITNYAMDRATEDFAEMVLYQTPRREV